MAATPGALVHSYLDDGPAVQFSHYGGYAGWAALELYVVEELLGARLAHSYGGLIPDPDDRAIVAFALDDLRDRDSIGTMVYGNTVDYTTDHAANERVLREYLTVDIGAQLHRPTGHAINPVPLTEAERIPSAHEILEVQLIAREVEREARRPPSHWAPLERQGAQLAHDARALPRPRPEAARRGRRRRRRPAGGPARPAPNATRRARPRRRPPDVEGGRRDAASRPGSRRRPRVSTAPASCSPCSRSTT